MKSSPCPKRPTAPAPRLSTLALALAAGGLLACLPLTASAGGEQCVKHEAYEAVTFLLVDKSDPLDDVSSLKQTLQSVKEMLIPGERLVVGTISAKLSDMHIIYDLVQPKPTIWESKIKLRAREKVATDCFAAMEAAAAAPAPKQEATALLETLAFVADILNAKKEVPHRVVLFSDMIQNSEALSLYGVKDLSPAAALAAVKKQNLSSDLKDAQVYAAGVGGKVSGKRALEIKEFWQSYFSAAGAKLHFYGPVLLGPS
jgi:hypothetical protein